MGRIDQAMRRAAQPADAASEAPEARDPNAPVVFLDEDDGPAVADAAARDAASEAPTVAVKAAAEAAVAEAVPEPAISIPADPEPPPPPVTPLFERVRQDLAQKIVIDDRILPASREQYRRLAAALHHAQEASGLKVVMIASAVAGEGKTLTASNLALTLSESYQRRVLLVDADLRKPMLDKLFQIDASTGLADGLVASRERRLPLHDVSAQLTILPAGQPSSDPMAGLVSSRMRRVLDEARRAFDWVIIDTPPVGLLSDASLLSAMVDGVVIVVKAEFTPYELVQRATTSLGEERVLGVVLNRSVTPDHSGAYAAGYGAYGSYGPSAAEGADGG